MLDNKKEYSYKENTNVRLDIEAKDMLKQYSADIGVPMSEIMTALIKMYVPNERLTKTLRK